MRFVKGVTALLMLGLLAACQTVVSSIPKNVLVQYDPNFPGKMAELGQAECQKYGKDAVLIDTISGTGLSFPTASFRCE